MGNSNSGGSDGENTAPAPLVDALESYLLSRGKGPDSSSGNYRRNAGPRLRAFIDYLAENDIQHLDEIDAHTLRNYIRDELLGKGHKPATIHKYYDYVSAWIGWAQREGLVAEHYGKQQSATEPLPDTDGQASEQQQTWRAEQRQQFLRFLDERAHDAIDERGYNAYAPARDRALAYVLAFSGVRGAEILAASDDDRRNGAPWSDLNEDYTSLEVLGKSQQWESRSLPPQIRPAIERWESILEPKSDWPLVPSFHYPSLYGVLPDDVDPDTLDGYGDIFEALREHDVRPPAMTTDGGRRLFRRLSEEAGIEVEEGYLQLHGARRGVGRVLALEQGANAAADQLANSVKVVEESYSDILASERAEKTGEAFDQHDG
jgi:integrase